MVSGTKRSGKPWNVHDPPLYCGWTKPTSHQLRLLIYQLDSVVPHPSQLLRCFVHLHGSGRRANSFSLTQSWHLESAPGGLAGRAHLTRNPNYPTAGGKELHVAFLKSTYTYI